ncbi:class I SAM-dependent methyltransferase [Deminuibacter soli]|uniref:Class I SAM-dependent methyltransferase n=1 Tax=Deminuibacter soli TaxID=2291815 RepID=A0A3E1NI45_9BACT|nr:class I SAM-dependent methyltransferase [Deminuibacter soli]RFM27541.1 class I SAM-dependent methyltransferase [Deminuibacter soli]
MPAIKWNTSLYNDKHSFVSKYGEDLLSWLQPQQGESILDLGCGSGQLANEISQFGALVTGMDSSPEMIEAAKASYPGIRFDHKNATDFSYDQPFDAIFSNAVLHWIGKKDAEKVIRCMYENLKPGGRLVVEFGGKGNVHNITTALHQVMQQEGLEDKMPPDFWYFPSIGEYTTLLEKNGFNVTSALLFDRPTPLSGEEGMENWLNMFGDVFCSSLTLEQRKLILNNTVERLRPTNYQPNTWYGTWYADYKRLRIQAIK